MKITANRELLLEAAKSVAGAASPKSPALPELEGILIEADMDNQQLKLTATNLQMVIQRRLKEIRIEQEGSVVIRAGLFCNMLKLLGGDDVTISQLDKQAVCVESGSAGYTVPGLRPDCFPAPEIPFPGDTIKIVGLPSLLKRTLFAAADADQKFEYQGVKLSFGVDCTTAAATDISRLAYVEADQCADGSLDILIHKHALKALCQIIKPSDELYIGIAAKSVVMLKEDLLFSARLIEGAFVDIGKMMNAVAKSSGAIVDAKAFCKEIDSINACAKFAAPNSLVQVEIAEKEIKLSTKNEISAASLSVPETETIQTPPGGFYYKPAIMLDFLRLASGDLEICIDDRGFMLLKANNSKYCVSPLRAPDEQKAEKPKTSKTKKSKAAIAA